MPCMDNHVAQSVSRVVSQNRKTYVDTCDQFCVVQMLRTVYCLFHAEMCL